MAELPDTTQGWKELVDYRLGKTLDEDVYEATGGAALDLGLSGEDQPRGEDDLLILPTGDALRVSWRTDVITPPEAIGELARELERADGGEDPDAKEAAMVLKRAAYAGSLDGRRATSQAYLEMARDILRSRLEDETEEPPDWRPAFGLRWVEERLAEVEHAS